MKRWLLILLLWAVPATGQDELFLSYYGIGPTPVAQQSIFQWTAPAPHHASIVRVSVSGAAGSGVHARLSDELSAVLTCAHVTGRNSQATVRWSDGTSTSGAVHIDRTGADSAVILTSHPTIAALPLASVSPNVGDQVEYLGFGGPSGMTLRPHRGNVLAFLGSDMRSTAPVVSGDSGGAILNARAEIVGLSAYGTGILTSVVSGGSRWNVYRPSGGPGLASLRDFAGRIVETQCGPGFSRPPSGGGLYPPTQPPMVPVPPPTPKPAAIDMDELIEKLVEKLAEDGRFRGPAGSDGADGEPGADGRDGEPGRDGVDGEPGADGPGPTDEQILAAVIAYFEDHPVHPPTYPPLSGWSHLVLVYPKSASYARRLEDTLRRAQEHYSLILTAEPPQYEVGEIPALVAYADGKADKVWRGLRQVEEALTAMTRGDFDSFLLR